LENRNRGGILVFGIGCLAALVFLLDPRVPMAVGGGMWLGDPVTRWLKLVILFLAFLTACLSLETRFTEHAGEYVVLVILAALGLMGLVGTEHLLMIFVCLELSSVSLYILTAMHHCRKESAEAALKYFFFGGVSAAFLLFGLSLVYGLTGELQLSRIAVLLSEKPPEPLLLVALVMGIMGFAFKVAAAPFHMWAPDAYEGAPVPTAAFIASASKIGGFIVLARVLMVGFAEAQGDSAWRHWAPGWAPVLAVLAVFSMLLGNLAALAQVRIRRLLAYSAIAHAGYVLVGLLAGNPQGVAAVVYYAVTYALTAMGAFAVVAVVREKTGGDTFEHWSGLSRRSPFLAFCMLVFLLSLAGIPPLAGFFGKFYLFLAALKAQPGSSGLLWLVVVALATSVVSLYYYLLLLKRIYGGEPDPDAAAIAALPSTRTALGFVAFFVFVLGACPEFLVGRLQDLLRQAGW
jgi:NADH-quinone oxidoreductase subunit N